MKNINSFEKKTPDFFRAEKNEYWINISFESYFSFYTTVYLYMTLNCMIIIKINENDAF